MTPQPPYGEHLAARDPIGASREVVAQLAVHASQWVPAAFDRSHEAGKWTAKQLLVHLAHAEMNFGLRVRMGLTNPNFVVQPFDQARWMAREPQMSGREALDLFVALAAMNLAFYESLSPADRATPITHPEQGAISIDWIIRLSAGHLIHHAKQLERIA